MKTKKPKKLRRPLCPECEVKAAIDFADLWLLILKLKKRVKYLEAKGRAK